jgi:hypothetical protein
MFFNAAHGAWRLVIVGALVVIAYGIGFNSAPGRAPTLAPTHILPAHNVAPAEGNVTGAAGFRWYVTSTVDHYTPYVCAAVNSALEHSDVAPRLILHADASIPRLRGVAPLLGVPVLRHKTSHDAELKHGVEVTFPADGDAGVTTARGTFVRFDVPLLAAAETLNTTFEWVAAHAQEAAAVMAMRPPRDNLCLYTDADVLFLPGAALLDDIASGELKVPEVFSASSEIDVTNYDHFNSGVMLFNIAGFLRIVDASEDAGGKHKIGRTSLPLVQTCPRARLRGATGRIAPVVTPAASSGGEGTPQPVVCLFTVRVLCMTFCDATVPKPHLHAALSGGGYSGLVYGPCTSLPCGPSNARRN